MAEHHHQPRFPITDQDKNWFFDRPGVIKGIVNSLYGACFLLFIADFFVAKHPYFVGHDAKSNGEVKGHDMPAYQGMIETFPNFYGFYGFIGCFFLVVAAAWLRNILMRDEDYYQRKEKKR